MPPMKTKLPRCGAYAPRREPLFYTDNSVHFAYGVTNLIYHVLEQSKSNRVILSEFSNKFTNAFLPVSVKSF